MKLSKDSPMLHSATSYIVMLIMVAFATAVSAEQVQIWDKQLPASARFAVLSKFNKEAVLDRETGLIWEKAPSGVLDSPDKSWGAAIQYCYNKIIGNRGGWRLPTAAEFMTIVDGANNPTLPSGHPFENVYPALYWTATPYPGRPEYAFDVDLAFGFGDVADNPKANEEFAWCVRGGESFYGE